MRNAIVLLAVIAVGCACNNAVAPSLDGGEQSLVGPPGPQGEQGIPGQKGDQGDVGPQGPQGIQGPPGGALVNIVDFDGGSGPCQYGGVKLIEVDGGAHHICNAAPGAKGDRGDIGPAGATGMQGPQGPAGLTPPSLSFFGIDGGLIGQAMSNPSDATGHLSLIYLKEQGCAARVDYSTNKVVPWESRILYTGLNCTGIAWIKQGSGNPMFPMTCVGAGPQVVKAMQPILVQQMNAQSAYYVSSTSADGGQTVGCYQFTDTGGFGVAAQPVTLSNIEGPFTIGMP